ncbi:MAG TPA: DNA polymerase I, partial [Candidatus Omnitrophica bacterium]|nr:DNA polymerase I [Candidatus Omnitrophota bacterium]
MDGRFILLHGNSLAYKAYYSTTSIPQAVERKGSVLSSFAKIVIRILHEYRPTHCATVFDKPAPARVRKSTFTFRRLHPAMPTSLFKELTHIREILTSFKIPIFQKEGYKASDIIGKLANFSSQKKLETIIISSDKEILQLISPYIKVVNPFQNYKVYTHQNIMEEFGVEPAKIPDFLALAGKKDGNIPGISGIGEKGAKRLLDEYGGLENIIKEIDKIKEEKKRSLLRKHSQRLLLYRKIAKINEEVPLKFRLADCKLEEYNPEEVKRVFKNFGLIDILLPLMGYEKPRQTNYRIILSEKELKDLIRILEKASEFSLDTETTSPSPTRADLVGISVSWSPGEACYIPLAHRYLGAPEQLNTKIVLHRLKPVLEKGEIFKVGQNIKYDYIVLQRAGVQLKGIHFDTMIASHLLNPVRGEHNLVHLALKHLGFKMLPFKELVGERKSIGEVEVEKVAQYACEDADFTLRVKDKLTPFLKKDGLEKIFHMIEIPLIPVLGEMEITGVKVDVNYLCEFSKSLEYEMRELSEEIYELAGEKFNLNSPQQLSSILFDKLKLTPHGRSKTGYSTSSSALNRLLGKHPTVSKILNYRNLSKLRDGFVEPLIHSVNPQTGRIHTSFHQAGTATGRLASSNPNLQNIPIRGERGKELRKAFIADGGNVLLSADYSQIELRIMAHFSLDSLLVEAFQKDKDIHTETAMHLFNLPEDKITQDERRKAKAVNFGIIYGISPYGLAESIGIEEKEAQSYISNYFSTHPRIKKF